jgi:hypothetical protein
VLACCSLFACAQIAGLEDPRPASTSKRSKNATSTPAAPGDALGAQEKGNTDDNNEADFEVKTPSIDFQSVTCNKDSVRELILRNKTGNSREFEVRIPEGAPFGFVDAPYSRTFKAHMPVNQLMSVKLVARPTTAGDVTENILVVSGTSFATVPVGVKGVGGKLEWAVTTADIGNTPFNTEGTTKATLKNVGTADVEIDDFDVVGSLGEFTAGPKDFVLPANGGEREVTLSLASKATSPGVKLTANVTPKAEGLCAVAPPVTVTGTRVDTKITLTGADWGKKDCSSGPSGQKSVVVKNYSPNPVKWKLKGSTQTFTLAGGDSNGTVPGASGANPGQVSIPFNGPSIPSTLGAITENVTVTVEPMQGGPPLPPPSGGDHTVTLRVDVRGAILAIQPTALDFTANDGQSDQDTFKIVNTGNERARLVWTFTRTSGEPAWLDLPQSTLTDTGQQTPRTVTYRPTNGPSTATLQPAESRQNGAGKICNPEALQIVSLVGAQPAPPP